MGVCGGVGAGEDVVSDNVGNAAAAVLVVVGVAAVVVVCPGSVGVVDG